MISKSRWRSKFVCHLNYHIALNVWYECFVTESASNHQQISTEKTVDTKILTKPPQFTNLEYINHIQSLRQLARSKYRIELEFAPARRRKSILILVIRSFVAFSPHGNTYSFDKCVSAVEHMTYLPLLAIEI